MSVVKILDDVTQWARQNICSKIQLKVPPANGEPNDYDYDYKKANPVAFTMYVPTDDKLPKDIPSAFPSLCVRFIEGEDNLTSMNGTIGIQLLLSAWNPGTYGGDRFTMYQGDAFHWTQDPDTKKEFQRNGEGWRDIWNFADIALQAVESTTHIAGYKIDRSIPVKFGPLTEQEAVADYYPFWFTWVSFQLTYPLRREIKEADKFL
jgi:hypothetical protein